MRETFLTVAGIVATDPTVRTFDDGRKVMSFRMASTSRRFDSAAKTWVDGHTLWVKVSCWRELADNAAQSVRKRDRVLVSGRVRSEQWTVEGGGQRSDLALEADALGHDLSYGIASFERKMRVVAQEVVTSEQVVDPTTGELLDAPGGEPAAPAPVPVFASDRAAADDAGADGSGRPQGPDGAGEEADDLDDLDDLPLHEGELARSA
jgi:single-strand DNA-binding protein